MGLQKLQEEMELQSQAGLDIEGSQTPNLVSERVIDQLGKAVNYLVMM